MNTGIHDLPASSSDGLSSNDDVYAAYLSIYDYATALPEQRANLSAPLHQDVEEPLINRLGKKFWWSCLAGYAPLYAALFLPQIALVPETTQEAWAIILPATLLFSALGAAISYWIVRRYHKKAQTMILVHAKASYEHIYPGRLKRWLWLGNLLPFFYLTFIVVPIVTRLQHLIGNLVDLRVAEPVTRKSRTGDSRLQKYLILREHLIKTISQIDGRKSDVIEVLQALFERSAREVVIKIQSISILLSTLGIAVSLSALTFKGTLLKDFGGGGFTGVMATTAIVVVAGTALYLISQLLIEGARGRDLRRVMDVIDVIKTETAGSNE